MGRLERALVLCLANGSRLRRRAARSSPGPGPAQDPNRSQALEKVSALLRRELLRWVRRGEALDMIVDHLPQPAE